LQLLQERWQVFRDGFPYLVQIDIEVQMNQAISHGHDLRPGDLGMSFFGFLSNAGSCFADYLDAFDEAKGPHKVVIQIVAGTS
jgi:hypothetical protein